MLWILLFCLWAGWRHPLVIVTPNTVVRWHRRGFRAFWRWKSRTKRRGRPRLTADERQLIGDIARDNPTWGAPRIHDELAKLGIEVSTTTVAKYMVGGDCPVPRRVEPPSAGPVRKHPMVGGLHHRYYREAA